MSVRWKPLIVLSGLFVTVALGGLVAFVLVSGQSNVEDVLTQARSAREAGKFEEAEIYYLQANQIESRNSEVHAEIADFYGDWIAQADASKRFHYQGLRLRHLLEATKFDKAALEPRQALLTESLKGDNTPEQIHWARQVIPLAPNDPDALYVLAIEALDEAPANIKEADRLLKVLQQVAPSRDRTSWIEARIAQYSKNTTDLKRILKTALEREPDASADEIDQLSRLRLLVVNLETAGDPEQHATALDRILSQNERILSQDGIQGTRIVELQRLARRVRDQLLELDSTSADQRWEPLAEVIDRGFQTALKSDDFVGVWIHQAYAEHLNLRGHRVACLEVIQNALTPEVVKDASLQDEVMRLRETAIKAALSDPSDADRFDKAQPHIEALIAGTRPEYQGLGHLFQGAIDLERSGLTGPRSGSAETDSTRPLADARNHLRDATLKLPEVGLAKALYGIALLMSGETALGRQHLLEAQRMGPLEARYQIWAAWSLLEAGYPEESERIVNRVVELADRDPSISSLSGTIQLLQGEIARSRKSPKDLEVARAAYAGSIVDGDEVPPAVSLRLAELTIALDGPEAGLAQLDDMRRHGGSTPALEALAVSTLVELDRIDDAITTLKAAREAAPDDAQLAVLHAAIALKQDQPNEADALLADFLADHPDDLTVAQTRARILSGVLDRADEARTVLTEIGERTGVTAPFVQLAMIDLAQGDLAAASKTVEIIRNRWPEASAGDLLDAQIALFERDFNAASKHLQAAIEKDPSNKVALFWKAQLDSRGGAPSRAAEDFEKLVRDGTMKELGNGLSLATAAEWSLAAMAMENKDFDKAIARLESIVQGDNAGSMERAARWQIIAARSEKGQWQDARKELIALLNEPESTIDERVQAADFFRRNGESEVAEKLVDQVLDRKPGHAGAVIIKSYLLSEQGKTPEAIDRLRAAIEHEEQPPAVYLMLAAFAGETQTSDNAFATIRTSLEQGLEAHPQSIDLLRSVYEVIRRTDGIDSALQFVENRVSLDTDDDRIQRLLVDLYTREGRLDDAETLIETIIERQPKNPRLAAGLVTIVSTKASQAARQNRPAEEQELNTRVLKLLETFRTQFPDDLRFPQAECELAIRQADYTKAEAVAREIEELNPESPIGPLLRAQVYRDQGLDERAIQAYRDALENNPLRDDIRMVLAQLLLELGRTDETLAEASRILDRSPGRADAVLLQASALASQTGTADQIERRQSEAVALLEQAIEQNPTFTKAYLEVARINYLRGRVDESIAILKAARETLPNDEQLLSGLIRYLVEPPADGSASGEANLAEALRIADEIGLEKATGTLSLAVALGFHRGGRSDLARPWAERAVSLIDEPLVHLTYGDILLSFAESQQDADSTRSLFEDAVAMYDKVLSHDSKSIEAVNNKAWILHRHLGKDQEALDLIEGLLTRVEQRTLPGEFFDTLGSIQQAVGRNKDAEQSYTEGLKKSPDLAVLNFHLGRLIAADPERSARANQYLTRAWDARAQLSSEDVSELETLLNRVGH
ncbi:tetratricopeptide repeat protein [Tautonia marina]|uniref:tetratricopeptide repeat protein n=1 Tax=Tautonia marina TaxID=2653855 RepID=UPI00126070B4|nr:tetratricopeptide repeat protein [Tautonia marina]